MFQHRGAWTVQSAYKVSLYISLPEYHSWTSIWCPTYQHIILYCKTHHRWGKGLFVVDPHIFLNILWPLVFLCSVPLNHHLHTSSWKSICIQSPGSLSPMCCFQQVIGTQNLPLLVLSRNFRRFQFPNWLLPSFPDWISVLIWSWRILFAFLRGITFTFLRGISFFLLTSHWYTPKQNKIDSN